MVDLKPATNRVITFYSYKGGVGRSMALANVGVLMAGWGYKILLVDWDLEAPGLENYFKAFINVVEVQQKSGLIDLLHEKKMTPSLEAGDLHWQSFVTRFDLSTTSLDLLTAGKRDENYFNKVREFDYNSFYNDADGGQFLEDLREAWLDAYDVILIDSRTGLTDSSGICSIHMPDILVLLFTPNYQSFNGISEVAHKAISGQKQIIYDRFKLRVLPVPCRIENAETTLLDEWMQRIQEGTASMMDWLPRKEVNVQEYSLAPATLINQLKIPYKTLYAFGERLAVVERGTSDPQDLGYVYETLAAVLANDLQNIHLLKDARDLLIKKAKGEEIVDYAELERKYADQQQATTQLTEELKRKDSFIEEKALLIKRKSRRNAWIFGSIAVLTLAAVIFFTAINSNSGKMLPGPTDSIAVVNIEQAQAADFATAYSTSSQQAELGFNLKMAAQFSQLDAAYQDTLADIRQKIEFAISYRFQDICDSFYLALRNGSMKKFQPFAKTVQRFATAYDQDAAVLATGIDKAAARSKPLNRPVDSSFRLKLIPGGFLVLYDVNGNVLPARAVAYQSISATDSFKFDYSQRIFYYNYLLKDSVAIVQKIVLPVTEVFFCPSNNKELYGIGNKLVEALKATKHFTVRSRNNYAGSKDPSSPFYFKAAQIKYGSRQDLALATEVQAIVARVTGKKLPLVPTRTPARNYVSVFMCDEAVPDLRQMNNPKALMLNKQ